MLNVIGLDDMKLTILIIEQNAYCCVLSIEVCGMVREYQKSERYIPIWGLLSECEW